MSLFESIVHPGAWTMTKTAIVGLLVGIVYFAGLAVGIKHALASSSMAKWLAFSAVLRLGLFLLVSSRIILNSGVWGLLSFLISFLMVRQFALIQTRRKIALDETSWN